MKRLSLLLLLAALLSACSPAAPTAPETTPETPVTATPLPEAVHDHEHAGEVVSLEVYQSMLDQATEQPINVEFVDPVTGIAYGTVLQGSKVQIKSLQDDTTRLLYEVDKQTEWVDVKALIDGQLVVLEKNPTTTKGRIFLLDLETLEETVIIEETIHHGPVTSQFVIRDGRIFFAYDKDGQEVDIVSYDPETKAIATEVENGFDLKLYQNEMYYLKLVDNLVGLFKQTEAGEEVELVEPGLNLYDYYYIDGKLDLLTFVLQGDTFYYLRIEDFHGGGPMGEFVFVQPNIWGEDMMIGTAEHQSLIMHNDHVHALPEVTEVGQDTYFTYDHAGIYYFITVNDAGTKYYSIPKETLQSLFND